MPASNNSQSASSKVSSASKTYKPIVANGPFSSSGIIYYSLTSVKKNIK